MGATLRMNVALRSLEGRLSYRVDVYDDLETAPGEQGTNLVEALEEKEMVDGLDVDHGGYEDQGPAPRLGLGPAQ